MIKIRINNEYKDIVKIFGGGTLQKEIIKVWSREAQEYVYESSVEYTGSLPITINANGDVLLDYRIYGADSGVGEPTENLWNPNTAEKKYIVFDGTISNKQTFALNTIPIEAGSTYYFYALENYTNNITYWQFQNNNDEIVGGDRLSRNLQRASFDAPSGATKVIICFGNAWDNDKIRDFGVYKRSTAPTSYIPYGYKLPMTVQSENLFDESTVESGGYIDTTSGDFVSHNAWTSSDYIKVTGDYVNLSGKLIGYLGGWSMIHNFYDSNKSWLGGDNALQGSGTLGKRKSKSYSISGVSYVRVSYRPVIFDDIMLVKGSTAPTSYIPYSRTDIPIYIGENQLDSVEGVSDYVDKSSGKIVRMIGEYTFTGDESFNKYGGSDVFYTSKTIDPVGITTVNTITMRCNHPAFTVIENKDTRYWLNPEADDVCCFLPGGMSQVFLRSTSNFTTATECKAYLKAQYDNGTPVKISYWLKTPVEEDPPVSFPDIPTIEGKTVIDYDGDPKPSQMYVKYRR